MQCSNFCSYSINSSASDINGAGIVSPSAFAVVRLMMNSNFVGCSTGRSAEDIAPALEALKGRVDALYVCSSPSLTTNRIQLNSLALGARLPTMSGFREYPVSGGLMSYGPNFPSLFRRAAEYVWAWLLPRDVAISIQTQTPTLDAAESIAVNIAKLPDRLSKPEDK